MQVSAIEKRFKIMRILFTSYWKKKYYNSIWKINSPIQTKIELAV